MSVTIQKIESLTRIDGTSCDKILVMGYNCIVDSGLFSVGDFCIILTPLTILVKNTMEELGPTKTDVTIRPEYREGILSEAKIIPVSILLKYSKGGYYNYINIAKKAANHDSSYIGYSLGNIGYCEKMLEASKKIPNDLPLYSHTGGCITFPQQTSRGYYTPERVLTTLSGKEYFISPQMDGIYATYGHSLTGKKEVVVGINNYKFRKKTIYSNLIDKYDLPKKLSGNYYLSGFMMGPEIYGNPAGLKEPTFFVDTIRNRQFSTIPFPDCGNIAKDLGLRFIPIEHFGKNLALSMEELKGMANGYYPNGRPKKGIIVRSFTYSNFLKIDNIAYKITEVFE